MSLHYHHQILLLAIRVGELFYCVSGVESRKLFYLGVNAFYFSQSNFLEFSSYGSVTVGPGIRLGRNGMGITCIETVILMPTRDIDGTLLNRIGRRKEVMRFLFIRIMF